MNTTITQSSDSITETVSEPIESKRLIFTGKFFIKSVIGSQYSFSDSVSAELVIQTSTLQNSAGTGSVTSSVDSLKWQGEVSIEKTLFLLSSFR